MTTIKSDTNSFAAVLFAVGGGKFKILLDEPDALPGNRYGKVLDDDANVIGGAYDSIYQGRGFCVHTKPFAGFVGLDQIEFVQK